MCKIGYLEDAHRQSDLTATDKLDHITRNDRIAVQIALGSFILLKEKEARIHHSEDAEEDESSGETTTIRNDGKEDLSKSAQSATSLRAEALQGATFESLMRFCKLTMNLTILALGVIILT